MKKLSTLFTYLHRKSSGSYYMSTTSKCIHLHYKSMHMPSRLHRIIAFTVKGRHVMLHVTVKPQLITSAKLSARARVHVQKLASMCPAHDCNKPQVVYRAVHLYRKLQNDREKSSISRKKQFYQILIVGNLENLAKNW